MVAKILEGRPLAAEIQDEIRREIQQLLKQGLPGPGLAVILVGEDPASQLYVNNKRRASEQVGIRLQSFNLPSETSESDLLALITSLNQDPLIHGILVQLPLPPQIRTETVIEAIDPEKDVDGFHPYNLGRLAIQRPLLRPCTPAGIMLLLDATKQPLSGLSATVIGISNIVGLPMILELLMRGATVTACHVLTQDLPSQIKNADILVVATGNPNLIQGSWIKPGAIVIDVGMNRLPDGQLVGDVDFLSAKQRAAWITPVPGGVGPMTVAHLLKNTLQAYQLQLNRENKLNPLENV